MIWKQRPGSDANPPTPMPSLVWRWLASRGLTTAQEIEEYLKPTLSRMAHPSKLKDMDKAVERLKTAFESQQKICIYGDYDLDGSSGIALLVAGLRGLGFKHVSFYQPSRFLEGYGINSDALDIIAQRGDQVVISVDCGITAIEEALHARSLGLDLIITDHHLGRQNEHGAEMIPEALAVVNPNQAACTSGLTYISGVGVGFYLLMGLKGVLPKTDFELKSLLDLFCIGTITDMVPLKNENRILVKHGLKILSKTDRPGLQALIKLLNLWGRDLESVDVAFSIAPKLNALSRLELGIRPLDVFMCEDQTEAQVLAEKVLVMNEKRKSLQAELEEKILAQLEEEKDKPVVVLSAQGHAGVVGLVATKVNQLSGKPAFIVALHGDEAVGSARGREEDALPTALAKADKVLDRFGGHAQAAGFSLQPENFASFKKILEEHYLNKQALRERGLEQGAGAFEKTFDADATLGDFSENFMAWLKQAGPFGSDNPAPLFKLSVDRVNKVRWLKGSHLKLTLGEGPSAVDALAFYAKSLPSHQVEVGEKIDLLVEPSWNYFRGERRLQLMIRDIKKFPELSP